MNERLTREIEFHEERFADGVGARPQDNFYAAVGGAKDLIDHKVLQCAKAGGDGLEIGCGNGVWLSKLLNATDFRAAGIDISTAAISSAKLRFGSATRPPNVSVMDANELKFEEGSFDFIYGTGVIHHLEMPRSLEEACRVLRVGGRFIFLEPLGTNPLIDIYRRATPDDRSPDETPLTPRHLAQIRSIFGDVQFTYFGFFTLFALPLRRWGTLQEKVLRLMAKLDAALFRIPGTWRLAWMVVIDATKQR